MKFAKKHDFDHFLFLFTGCPRYYAESNPPANFTRKDAFPSPWSVSSVFNTALNGCSHHRSLWAEQVGMLD